MSQKGLCMRMLLIAAVAAMIAVPATAQVAADTPSLDFTVPDQVAPAQPSLDDIGVVYAQEPQVDCDRVLRLQRILELELRLEHLDAELERQFAELREAQRGRMTPSERVWFDLMAEFQSRSRAFRERQSQ